MGSGPHQSLFSDPCALHGGNMLFHLGTKSMISMEENPRIRPFFTSPDEIYDEEYYDEQLPEKKRRLTTEQVHLLEKSFEAENKLEPERKTELAKKLGLQPRQVAVWFQNRRARWKTKQVERDYDLLKLSYDSLALSYDAILKENDKLKSQVLTLTEKLEEGNDVNDKPIPDPGPAADHEPGTRGIEVDPTADPNQMELAQDHSAQQLFFANTEDRLSSRSGGSAVVNEDTNAQQLAVDSGENCYFPDEDQQYGPQCVGHFPSDENDGSDEGPSYLSEVFLTSSDVNHQHHHHHVMQQHQHGGETMGWWVW